MDFRFTLEQEQFREEVREFLRQALPADWQGAGGYGDPFARPADLVAEEVRAELISLDCARRDYGVVVDPKTFAVDEAASAKLRKAAR